MKEKVYDRIRYEEDNSNKYMENFEYLLNSFLFVPVLSQGNAESVLVLLSGLEAHHR